MTENTSRSKSSFFKEYFLYKLHTLRGFTILFAVLNFLSVTVFPAGVMVFIQSFINRENNDADIYGVYYGYGGVYIFVMFLYLMIALIFTTLIILAVLPAINFRYFNRRSYMDTLGGLPITGKQRFLGDILSGAASFGISFVPCSVAAIILAGITEFSLLPQLNSYTYDQVISADIDGNYFGFALTILLTMLLCYAAAYAISCFVTSCCGKVGTSVLFSFIMMGALTIIPLSIGGFIIDNAKGFDPDSANISVISAIPPIGTIIATLMKSTSYAPFVEYPVKTPLVLVILLIIAVFGLGAYLIAARRKTERVERELVFNSGYYIIPAIITLMAGSFSIWLARDNRSYIVPLVLVSLAACLVMAFLDSRSFKKIWKGAVVFAAAGLFSLGLGLTIQGTEGFGISKLIPSEKSVESILLFGTPISATFSGGEFNGEITVESEDGISLVISEHQKIVDELKSFSYSEDYSGFPLTIYYKLKNGMTVTRRYSYLGGEDAVADDPTYKLAQKLSELPEMRSKTMFGIFSDPEMPCTGIVYEGRNPNGPLSDPNYIDTDIVITTTLFVKPSAYDKFIDCYTEDYMKYSGKPDELTVGIFKYQYLDKNGTPKWFSSTIWGNFEKTLEFLKDQNNFEEELNINFEDAKKFYVTFRDTNNLGQLPNSSISFSITHPELAREFLSYIESEFSVSEEDISPCFTVSSVDKNGSYYNFHIKKENEQAALKAFIDAIYAHGKIS